MLQYNSLYVVVLQPSLSHEVAIHVREKLLLDYVEYGIANTCKIDNFVNGSHITIF